MMRFIRVCRDMDTGDVLAVIEQGVPFETGGHIEIEGRACEMLDLGACEEFDSVGANNRAAFIRERLEKHPLADTHEDAPKVRVKPDAEDAPTIHFTPCGIADINAHCEARGRDALPPAAAAALREMLAHREDVPLKTLAALGFSFDELKRHPRVLAKRQALDMARIAAQQAAAAAEAEATEAAKRQARIERRLNKGAV